MVGKCAGMFGDQGQHEFMLKFML